MAAKQPVPARAAVSQTARKVMAARVALILSQPFFGMLALRLKVIETSAVPTAATDGTSLLFNPAFVESLSHDELVGLIAHEVMHCALGHPWRRGGRQPKRWNIAADHVINLILTDAKFKLPADGYCDAQYAGMSSEQVYDRLPESADQNPDTSQGTCLDAPAGDGSSAGDSDSDGDGNSNSQQPGSPQQQQPAQAPNMTESDWQQAARQAAALADGQGKLPASMQRLITEALRPRADWRSVLRRFVSETSKADYAWTRPNRRYLSQGLYLPALHSERCGRIAVAVDTSGSIDDVLLAQFSAELNSIISEVRPTAVDVLYCDAALHAVRTYDSDSGPIALEAIGGGGTDFNPVFDYYDQPDAEPIIALVYLTDLYGSFPQTEPDYPVLWAVTGSADHAPFGETVRLD